MKVYFLEHLPDEIIPELMQSNPNIDVFALTPQACYQLDLYGIEYDLPEYIYYPQRIDIEETYFSKVKIEAFALHVFERIETEEYWKEFIRVYKKIENIIELDYVYYGDQLLFKNILLKVNNVG